ncbi:MAG TPA: NAD(P)-dependent oxidoreductase [Pyrinomonadaceae bacterium]|jgi:nucleoside-diphosphate-sugar epimerase|nr:NAD(P)-dependent oxidoreductase [Pyrinomonadaceae bacterium]
MKKILVTGGTGFVGKAIVSELAKGGHDIYTCAKSTQPQLPELPNYFSVDISSRESVEESAGKLTAIDCVIHSAGLAHQFKAPKDPQAFTRINVEGTRNIAQMAADKEIKNFVLVSSISVYGDGKPNPTDEDYPCRPTGSYAVSKYEAELAAREVCEANNIALTILRLATVYGEGDVGNVLRLIKLIDSGKFFWTGKGENGKSLIFSEDAARACRIAAEKQLPGINIYNVTDTPHTMREIVAEIARQLGKKIPGIIIPAALIKSALGAAGILPVVGKRARGLAETLKKWRSDDVLAGGKIERELNFSAETPLAEGIKKEVAWYLNIK